MLHITLVLLMLPLNLQADKPSAPPIDLETLTLDQAISYALKHSPEIKQAQLTVAIAQLDLKQTELKYWLIPDLTLHTYRPGASDLEPRFGVTVNFDLKKLLTNTYRYKQNQLKLFDAQIYLTNVKNKVIASVTQNYFDMIIAKKKVEILQDQLQNNVKLQELLRIKFESGQIQIKQLLDVIENTANLRLELLKAQADLKLKELHLKQVIGLENELEEGVRAEEKGGKLSSLSHSLTPHSKK